MQLLNDMYSRSDVLSRNGVICNRVLVGRSYTAFRSMLEVSILLMKRQDAKNKLPRTKSAILEPVQTIDRLGLLE